MIRISLAGHLCVDLTPRLGASISTNPGDLIEVGPLSIALGGSVANTARTLATLGHPVRAYASVGADELGAIVRARLDSPLVEARLRTVSAATSYSIVVEPAGSDRTFWHHAGANALVDGTDIDLDESDLLHLGYPSLLPRLLGAAGEPLAELLARARERGVTTSIDLAVVDDSAEYAAVDWEAALRRIVAQTDVITPSLDDLTSALPAHPRDAESLAEKLVAWGAAVAVVSAGASGLVLRTGDADRLRKAGRALSAQADAWADRSLRMAALPVPAIVTTNGAGDASTAAILFAIANGMEPEEALRLATASSAAVLTGAATPTGR